MSRIISGGTIARGASVLYAADLVVMQCSECSVTYAIPSEMKQRLLSSSRKTFYCPNGHAQVFTGPTPEQREKARADSYQAMWRSAADQLEAEQRSKAALKGHLTRLRNRIADGVCPCCRRNFDNVRRHIRSQHPEWAAENVEALTSA